MRICDLIPNPEDLLALTIEELAGVLLGHLNSRNSDDNDEPGLNYLGFCNNLKRNPEYQSHVLEVRRALIEAWAWLASEGFLVNDLSRGLDWYFITRRGRQINTREAFAAYRKASLLPKGQLHASIATKVDPAFLRGEYDTAIFQALREVEVTVRRAGNFPAEVVGVNLITEPRPQEAVFRYRAVTARERILLGHRTARSLFQTKAFTRVEISDGGKFYCLCSCSISLQPHTTGFENDWSCFGRS